jgi:hypothetical protein
MSSLLATLAAATLFAAPPDDKKEAARIKERADEICKLMLKGDHARFVELTHPAAVKEAGGRDKLIERLKDAAKELKSKGIEVLAIKAGDPAESATAGGDRYVVVPYETELKVLGSKTTAKSFLLAISEDAGKTWTFVDGAGLRDPAKRKRLLPNLPDSLRLPRAQ